MAGATYDIVVLSSSPPDSRDVAPRALSPASPFERRVAMPSSPLRSLSPLLSPPRMASSASRTALRAAPVPVEAERGFATARSLLADINIHDRGLRAIEAALESRRAPTGPEHTIKASKPPRKRATKATKTGDAGEDAADLKAQPKPRGRKPKNTSAEEASSKAPDARTTTITSGHFAKMPATDADASTREHAAPRPESKATKPRKPRAKKATANDGEIQTTIKSAKVKKPRATSKATKKVQEKTAEVVSAHFQSRATINSRDTLGQQQDVTNTGDHDSRSNDGPIWEVPLSPSGRPNSPARQRAADLGLPLDLDEAVGRRRDWTPPPDSARQEILTSSTGKENKPVPGNESFTTLLSAYAYARSDSQSEPLAAESKFGEVVGATKRRRVELVDLPVNNGTSRQASPEKGKAPKKKPRTITDLVTRQYAPQQAEPESLENNSEWFAPRTTSVTQTTKVSLNDTGDADSTKISKKPVRKRSTSKSALKSSEPRGKSKKASAKTAARPKLVEEKLLSPASALIRLNRQDILFGTSSQLAREESPTMLREIQRAIRESEQDADICQALASDGALGTAPWPRLQRIEGRRALWKASSRDDEGHMLERENVYLPEPDRTQDFPLLIDRIPDKSDDSFLNINDFVPPPQAVIPITSDLPTPPSVIAHDGGVTIEENPAKSSPFHDIDNFLQDSPPATAGDNGVPKGNNAQSSPFRVIDDFPQNVPPSNQNADSSFLDIDDFAPSAQPPATDPLPGATSSGSPKRRRGRPPKSQSAIPPQIPAPAPINAPNEASTRLQPSKTIPPSTPRKSKSRFHSIEAILDSEDDEALSPTPPRTRRLEDSPPLPLISDAASAPTKATSDDLVPIHRIPDAKLIFDDLRPSLFPRITSLIRSLPPTTDPSKPSWHEKILMYDPIVAEDFTAFLNAHEHIRTYKRATQKQVKAWNKHLKQTGGEEVTVAEGEGLVLAVEKEVEAWMVQKWCEEMSVCCVFKERKNGGARKGMY